MSEWRKPELADEVSRYAVGPLDSRFRGNDGYVVERFHAELRNSYPL